MKWPDPPLAEAIDLCEWALERKKPTCSCFSKSFNAFRVFVLDCGFSCGFVPAEAVSLGGHTRFKTHRSFPSQSCYAHMAKSRSLSRRSLLSRVEESPYSSWKATAWTALPERSEGKWSQRSRADINSSSHFLLFSTSMLIQNVYRGNVYWHVGGGQSDPSGS